jgi:hypothetical protein
MSSRICSLNIADKIDFDVATNPMLLAERCFEFVDFDVVERGFRHLHPTMTWGHYQPVNQEPVGRSPLYRKRLSVVRFAGPLFRDHIACALAAHKLQPVETVADLLLLAWQHGEVFDRFGSVLVLGAERVQGTLSDQYSHHNVAPALYQAKGKRCIGLEGIMPLLPTMNVLAEAL